MNMCDLIWFFKACDRGSYGTDCNQNCGRCRYVDDCFHVNGTCFSGCDVGYDGNLCKSRKYEIVTTVLVKRIN